MNHTQYERMKKDRGFVAALDQSGGSTPKALQVYGIQEDRYANEDEMFDLVHAMRTRIIKSPAFSSDYILAAILFEQTMDRKVDDQYTADYLWEKKGIVPFLKVDKGLVEEENGVLPMKPIEGLDAMLDRAVERNIFGTKMRSVIRSYDEKGIDAIVEQQFTVGKRILAKGLIPILEPEVDIHAQKKDKIETRLKKKLLEGLDQLSKEQEVMLKLTLPTIPDFFRELIEHPRVLRVVALSGGYSREEANRQLAENPGLIASFSRALSEGLRAEQTEEDFDRQMKESVESIYEASIL